MIGTSEAMNSAARKTPSSVCAWIDGRRTESGWMSGLFSTSNGQRKSFHDASTAKTVGTGVILLSVYSLGLGVPFFLSSLALNSFLSASRRIRGSLRTIEVASGVVLILFGILLVTDLFPRFVAFLARFLPAVG